MEASRLGRPSLSRDAIEAAPTGAPIPQYDDLVMNPLDRWAAWLLFTVGVWLVKCGVNRLPEWHPFRVFNEGCLHVHADVRTRLPFSGIIHVGRRERRVVTLLKVIAIMVFVWMIASVLFDLGTLDLFGFDLIRFSSDA